MRRKKLTREENYLAEKHLQQDSEEPNISQLVNAARKYKSVLNRGMQFLRKEEEKKVTVCLQMAELISGNFKGWKLRFNESVFGSAEPDLARGFQSVEIYRDGNLIGHRLVVPNASAEKALAEISNAFLVAMEKAKEVEKLKEAKNHNTLEKRQETAVHGQ